MSGTTYWKADDSIHNILSELITNYHPDIDESQAKICILFAARVKGPAVKHGGYPAFATVKINSLKDRVMKGFDAEILIDATEWRKSNPTQQRALLDHELSHIEVKRKKPVKNKKSKESDDGDNDGSSQTVAKEEIMTDDIGRPKLATKKADWNVGDGFASIVRRYGENSVELYNIQKANEMIDELISAKQET